MTTTVDVVVPDVLGDLRAALRGLPDLVGLTDARVFFSTPMNTAWPAIRLTESGLTPTDSGSDAPVWSQRITIEVMGAPAKGGVASDYYKVTSAKNIIVSWIWALAGLTGTTTRFAGGTVDTVTDNPDPDDGGPRKVISAVFTVVAL